MFDVQERFFRPFESAFPDEATLSDPAASSLVFAKAGLENLVEYGTLSSALRIESIGLATNLEAGMGELFDGAPGFIAAIGNMQSETNLPDMLVAGADALTGVLDAAGAFDSVPIVAFVIGFIVDNTAMIIDAYGQAQTEQVEAAQMGYSRDSDQDYVRAGAKLFGGDDVTRMFLPANDASAGVDDLNVDVEMGWHGHRSEVTKLILVPRGNETGLGALPNTMLNPRGWQTDPDDRPLYIPWGKYKPAFTQSTMQAWQGLLTNSRATYLVDAVRLADGWRAWTSNMMQWGTSGRYGKEKRRWILGTLMSTASLGWDAQNKVAAAGYARVLPWTPRRGEGINYEATIGDFGIWAAEAQLGRRQRKYLGTLTVAYVSEGDAAFRSDPELRQLLTDRRAQLLNDPALNLVDLSQVVDADYRQAIATRQGPDKLVLAPTGGPAGPRRLAGGVPKVGGAVQGPAFAGASPMLGGGARSSSSSGAGGLVALGVLALLMGGR